MGRYADLAGKNYLELTDDNFLHRIKHLISKDGKSQDGRYVARLGQDPDGPWIYTVPAEKKACFAWHHVYFKHYGFIPKGCLGCWKVVARPNTLRQLVKVLKWQEEFGKPGKCGIERRRYVGANYGAYWYCDSKEEGLERWEEVMAAVVNGLGKGITVGLKRGCTEYEMKFGDSRKWDELYEGEGWERIEKRLNASLMFEIARPPAFDENVMLEWIHWAYERGDETWKEFMPEGSDGLFPPLVWYHPKPVKVLLDPVAFEERMFNG